jgi:hypothetical protein
MALENGHVRWASRRLVFRPEKLLDRAQRLPRQHGVAEISAKPRVHLCSKVGLEKTRNQGYGLPAARLGIWAAIRAMYL